MTHRLHVTHDKSYGHWSVRRDSASGKVARYFDSKDDAVRHAHSHLARNSGGVLYLHGVDGGHEDRLEVHPVR